MNFLTDANKVA